MLPAPAAIFVDADITITDPDGGTDYRLEVTNYAEGQREAFAAECVEMGKKLFIYIVGRVETTNYQKKISKL